MFHLAERQMKLTRDRAEWRSWMRASQEAQHFLAPGETRGNNHPCIPTAQPRLARGGYTPKPPTAPEGRAACGAVRRIGQTAKRVCPAGVKAPDGPRSGARRLRRGKGDWTVPKCTAPAGGEEPWGGSESRRVGRARIKVRSSHAFADSNTPPTPVHANACTSLMPAASQMEKGPSGSMPDGPW